jgi:D-alanine-D-alanine ligase
MNNFLHLIDKNLQNKNIIVLYGGTSTEREVSINSANSVFNAFKETKYNIIPYDLTENIDDFCLFLSKNKSNSIIFNTLHGGVGEDGRIQALLDFYQIPYTHSGFLSSSLAMHKSFTKKLLMLKGVLSPKEQIYSFQKDENIHLEFPLVLKPINEGSSTNLYLIKNLQEFKSITNNIKKKFKQVLLEEYIKGRELTVGVINGEALAITEMIYDGDLFDYDTKYNKKIQHIINPINIPNELSLIIKNNAEVAYQELLCSGAIRVDFILSETQIPYLLEVNTQPGLTSTSLLPEQASYLGISFVNLCLIMLSLSNYKSIS